MDGNNETQSWKSLNIDEFTQKRKTNPNLPFQSFCWWLYFWPILCTCSILDKNMRHVGIVTSPNPPSSLPYSFYTNSRFLWKGLSSFWPSDPPIGKNEQNNIWPAPWYLPILFATFCRQSCAQCIMYKCMLVQMNSLKWPSGWMCQCIHDVHCTTSTHITFVNLSHFMWEPSILEQ